MTPTHTANGEFIHYLPWLFIGFGVFFTGLSAWLIRRALRGRHWRETKGRVTGHATHLSRRDSGGSVLMYASEIEYRLPGLPPATFTDDVSTNKPQPVGTIVPLRYNPDDHDEVMVWAPLSRGLFFLIFLVMGLIFIGCGIFANDMIS